jgi:histidinol-phosphatase
VYSSYPSIVGSGWAPGFGSLLTKVWRDRGLGDFYGYMLVAEGAAEVMIEAELKIWDLAGPRAILQHAGGSITDIAGGDDLPAHGVLATNGRLHETILAELARG